ncbi:MAG: RadC family protein [Draconibacterium sp.]
MTNLFSLNEITVSYSRKLKLTDLPKITCSKDAYDLVYPFWIVDIDHRESFKILLLSRANRVLGISNLFVGGLSGVVVDPKMIFQTALKCNSQSIILCHNHPSGNLQASDADLKLTHKMVEIGKLLDLPILDHIIFTRESYYSFSDNGEL